MKSLQSGDCPIVSFESPFTSRAVVCCAKAFVCNCSSLEVASRVNVTMRDETIKKPFLFEAQP